MYEKFGNNDVNKISKLFLDKYLVPQTRPKLKIKKDMNFSSKIINNKKSKIIQFLLMRVTEESLAQLVQMVPMKKHNITSI